MSAPAPGTVPASVPIYQVDAFASALFKGNPAAVCPLEDWLPDELMQAVAAENNLSETAFFKGSAGRYELRWFTPASEIDLCGHATLASAYVIVNFLEQGLGRVEFSTMSGPLVVERQGELLDMDFPAWTPTPCRPEPWVAECLARGLGKAPREVLVSRDYLAAFETEEEVAAITPDFASLGRLDRLGIIATAPGREVDFVSRFFAPKVSVPEDPVTGSAHSTLVPYWSARLGKSRLHARQISARGGELYCVHLGERVRMAGRAVLYLRGEILLSSAGRSLGGA